MKKIVICDYSNVMEESYDRTIQALKDSMGTDLDNYEVVIEEYKSDKQLIELLQGAEGLITAFLEIGEDILSKTSELKCISISAVGYGNIDCDVANRYGVKVCHIEEYCTQEVAEHTFSLIGALNRNLMFYRNSIEKNHKWVYHEIAGGRTLSNKTLAIWGYGRIGKRVAEIARGFRMTVLAVDPYANPESAKKEGVEIVSADEALRRADVISNHMNLTRDNKYYFCENTFSKMERKPIFVNVGRGACVKEADLVAALDNGLISAAGLDVLEAEEPDLSQCKLLGRDNVIITPHSAFYSDDSIEALQKISGENMGFYLCEKIDKVFSIVRECKDGINS